MIGSIRAELLVLSKRMATWILLGIWTVLAVMFGYLVPYLRLGMDPNVPVARQVEQLLPAQLVGNLSGGFPFYGGVFAIMLGVLTFGSEYGWGTFKTLFTQRPSRLRVIVAKLIAVGVMLVPFVVAVFLVGVAGSLIVASKESAPVVWPALGLVARGLLADWFILAVWASFGVALAVLSRGTSLAIGVGILYTLVIEGLLSALASEVSLFDPLVKFFMRANAYSLIQALGATSAGTASNGPGSFAGPFVGTLQALVVLSVYAVVFLGISALLVHRRDIA